MEREAPQARTKRANATPLTEAQKAELDRRLELTDGAVGRPWSEVRAELIAVR